MKYFKYTTFFILFFLAGCYDKDTSAYHPALSYLSSIYEDTNGDLYLARKYHSLTQIVIMKFDTNMHQWKNISKSIDIEKNIDIEISHFYREENQFHLDLLSQSKVFLTIDISSEPYDILWETEENDNLVSQNNYYHNHFDNDETAWEQLKIKYPYYKTFFEDTGKNIYIDTDKNLYLFKDEHLVGDRNIIFEYYTKDNPNKPKYKQKLKWE